MPSLVITADHLQERFQRALAPERSAETVSPLYRSSGAKRTELLAPSATDTRSPIPPPSGRLVVWKGGDSGPAWQALRGRHASSPGEWLVGIEVGDRSDGRIRVHAQAPLDPSAAPGAGEDPGIECLKVVGRGLVWINPLPELRVPVSAEWLAADGPHSRVIGALGLPLFETLQHLHVAVIGAGGTGSALSELLCHYLRGAARLTLVDPDRLTAGNIGTWGEVPANGRPGAGRLKVELLAERIRRRSDAPFVEPLAVSVGDWRALPFLKEADLMFSCVDNPCARRAAAKLAALYCKPLVDIGTAIFLGDGAEEHSGHVPGAEADPVRTALQLGRLPTALLAPAPERRFQADVRLLVPGTGCLLCYGGTGEVAPRKEPEKVLGKLSPTSEKSLPSSVPPPESAPFWRHRAGSSSHWNLAAVTEAADLVLGFLRGELTRSVHRQRIHRLGACSAWVDVDHSPHRNCLVCRLAGTGDAGLRRIGSTPAGGGEW